MCWWPWASHFTALASCLLSWVEVLPNYENLWEVEEKQGFLIIWNAWNRKQLLPIGADINGKNGRREAEEETWGKERVDGYILDFF